MTRVMSDSDETRALLEQVGAGDRQAFERLFIRHRPVIRQFVSLRLDNVLRARIDPSDVVQETQLEAFRRLPEYQERRPMPFGLWLRKTAYERLLMFRRQHVDAACRTLVRELPLPGRSSVVLAQQLIAPGPSPSQELIQHERARLVRIAVAALPDLDREILLMRNFEELSYAEVAQILNIDQAAARKRHGRALLRLHELLSASDLTESAP
jgi:RNA polymerase sigma-70 factor (ECF subfamily)